MSAKFDVYSGTLVRQYWADYLERETEVRQAALDASRRMDQIEYADTIPASFSGDTKHQ